MKYQISTGAPAAELEKDLQNDKRLTVIGKGVGDSVIIETEHIKEICDDYCANYAAIK